MKKMIEVGYLREKEKVKYLPQEIQETIQGILQILCNNSILQIGTLKLVIYIIIKYINACINKGDYG